MTLEEMGLYELLEKNNTMFWQWRTDDKAKTLKDASQTEIYFSSVNAIAETGEIINIDGTGNRVASTIYGHEKVYFVLGTNKRSAFYPCNVVYASAVKVAAGEFFLVELNHFAGGAGFGAQFFGLFFGSVDPDDLVRRAESRHFVDPVQNVLVVCH